MHHRGHDQRLPRAKYGTTDGPGGWTRTRTTRVALTVVAVVAALASCTSPAPGPATSGPPSSESRSGPQPAEPQVCEGVPKGRITVHHLQSEATGRRERYRTYQSPTFRPSEPAALLVLLHGAGADETQWLDVGITSAADCLAASGELGPTLIVLIDGSSVEGDRTDASPPMERLVTDEVIPTVRQAHPNLSGRADTSIGGISIGGGWALTIAAHRPDLFAAVGGHSPAAQVSDEDARALRAEGLRVWLDVGDGDGLADRVTTIESTLRGAGIDPMVLRSSGVHDRRYWSQHTEDYLRFYLRLW